MKKLVYIALSAAVFSNCATSRLSNKREKETVKMKIDQHSNVIDYARLEKQQIPTVSNRIAASREGERGLITAGLVSQAISLGANAVKKLIDNENKKL